MAPDPTLITTIAQYGPWGVVATLLLMNWFVIKRLFETLERHNEMFTDKLDAFSKSLDSVHDSVQQMRASNDGLAVEMRRRKCMVDGDK
jgi:hypothetical protein